MPVIRSIATAAPPHQIAQDDAREFARAHFAGSFSNIERYLPVFQHAEIDSRSLVVPAEWFLQPRTFQECNDLFIEWANRLGKDTALRCLEAANLRPQDIDKLVFVSTTGMANPGLDAHLINTLKMGMHTRRTSMWGMGCAGGVSGLSRAYEYTLAFPHHRALLICVELCSITFQWEDRSRRNLIASALFSDGAAAVLVEGDAVEPVSPVSPVEAVPQATSLSHTILGTRSTIWHDTLDIMGWEIVNTGMRVIFSTRIPSIVRDLMYDNVTSFLAEHQLGIDDISQFILHPGGAKVIRAYEASLNLAPERLSHVRETLRQYGNMSSPTVFFVYESVLQQQPLKPGEYGLLVVLGPGFSSEMALIRG